MTQDEKELSRFFPATNLSDTQKKNMETLNGRFGDLANTIFNYVPVSADRSSAIRYLRLALMQCNSAICHDVSNENF